MLERLEDRLMLDSLPISVLPGDYSGDGVVNTPDYTVWADNFGGDASVAFAPGSRGQLNSGPINTADYTLWADNFGLKATVVSVINPGASNNPNAPQIVGTVTDVNAVVEVTIDGVTRTAYHSSSDPTVWFLPAGQFGPLSEGVYDIQVYAYNATTGAAATDSTVNELVIDLTAPTVAFNSLVTTSTTPTVTGTSAGAAQIRLWLNYPNGPREDFPYFAIPNAQGDWAIALPQAPFTGLTERAYTVTVTADDMAGNFTRIDIVGGLRITSIPLAVAVNPVLSTSPSPELTGTVNDVEATVMVTVNGQSYQAILNSDPSVTNPYGGPGTWRLPAGTIAPLANGIYDVAVTASQGGDVATDNTVNELLVNVPQSLMPLAASQDVSPQVNFSAESVSPSLLAESVSVTVAESSVPAARLDAPRPEYHRAVTRRDRVSGRSRGTVDEPAVDLLAAAPLVLPL